MLVGNSNGDIEEFKLNTYGGGLSQTDLEKRATFLLSEKKGVSEILVGDSGKYVVAMGEGGELKSIRQNS